MEKPKGDPCEMSRRDLLQGIVKGSAIAGAVGLVGSDVLGFTGSTIPANAADYAAATPFNRAFFPKSSQQRACVPARKAENFQGDGGVDFSRTDVNWAYFAAYSCGVYASYNALVKIGTIPKNMTVIDYASELMNLGTISDWQWFNTFGTAGVPGDVPVTENRGSFSLAQIKAAYDEGAVPIVRVEGNGIGHYVMVDYFEGEEAVIIDSDSMGYKYLSGYIKYGAPVNQMHLFKGPKAAKDLPRLFDQAGPGEGGTSGGGEKEEKKATGGYVIRGEEDLRGMESYKQWKTSIDSQNANSREANWVLSPGDLSIGENKQIAELGSAIRDGKKTPQDYLGVGVSFVGLLGMVYSMFMFMTFLFDRSNNIVDANLLRKLTFGKMETVHDQEDVRQEGGTRYVSWKGILTWAGLCIVISMLLLTGALFDFISWFAQIVRGS